MAQVYIIQSDIVNIIGPKLRLSTTVFLGPLYKNICFYFINICIYLSIHLSFWVYVCPSIYLSYAGRSGSYVVLHLRQYKQ